MKCKHDKCNRKGTKKDNGFCNKCIQLPTKECNYCETKEENKSEQRKISDKIMGMYNHREKIIKCPHCKVNMGKMSNGRYVIDKCPKCKGIFLHGNEINMIKHISFFHYVKDYFRKDKHE